MVARDDLRKDFSTAADLRENFDSATTLLIKKISDSMALVNKVAGSTRADMSKYLPSPEVARAMRDFKMAEEELLDATPQAKEVVNKAYAKIARARKPGGLGL